MRSASLIERTLIRFLYGRPLETLLATWGLSLILQQAVRSIFGPTNQDVSSPAWMSGAVSLGGLVLTVNRLWIILFCGAGARRPDGGCCAGAGSAAAFAP